MDILSHGLWSGAAGRAVNLKIKRPLNIKWAVFWGVFPDLFAFTIPFIILFWKILFGPLEFADWPKPVEEPAPTDALNIFRATAILYSASHSLAIFAIIFGLVFLIWKRPVWELSGWFLHILLDIPTHTYKFYPTPVFWPFAEWKFSGFVWSEPWFLIPNYLAIILIYLLLFRRSKFLVR